MLSRRPSGWMSIALAVAAVAVLAPRLRTQEPPLPGTLVSLDPRFDALVPKAATLEKLARRLLVGGRAGLGSEGTGHPLFRHPQQRRPQVEGGRRPQRVPSPGGIYRQRAVHGTGAGQQRSHVGCRAPPRALSARRSAHRTARCTRAVHDARRPVPGQAPEQPQRPGLQIERGPVFHRSAVRPARHVHGSGSRARFHRRVPVLEDRSADAPHEGPEGAERDRVLTGREDALRRPVRRRASRSSWPIP